MRNLLLILLLLPGICSAQSILNGDFNNQGTNWGCNPEAWFFETTYGGVDPTNRVAEVDVQVGLCQTVSGFVIGREYELSFDCSRRSNCGPTLQSVVVTIDGGALLANVQRNGIPWGWQKERFCFIATDTTHTLEIDGTSPTTCGLIFDNIEIRDLDLDLGNDTTLCLSDSLFFELDYPDASFVWQDLSTDSAYSIFQSGIYVVTITTLCQTQTDSIQVQYASYQISLGNDTSVCAVDSILLSVDTASFQNILWSTGDTSMYLHVHQAQSIWVQAMDQCGSQTSDTIEISLLPLPFLDLGADTTICAGDDVHISAGQNYDQILWIDGSSDTSLSVDTQGWVWAQAVNPCGSHTDSIYINVFTFQPWLYPFDTTICRGQELQIYSPQNDVDLLWSNGSQQSGIHIDHSGWIWLQRSMDECIQKDSLELFLEDCDPVIVVPNVFSPNQDGINDHFDISAQRVEYFHLLIFDRWGGIVFESYDPEDSWDGNIGGSLASQGTYYWLLEYGAIGQVVEKDQGYLSLFR